MEEYISTFFSVLKVVKVEEHCDDVEGEMFKILPVLRRDAR